MTPDTKPLRERPWVQKAAAATRIDLAPGHEPPSPAQVVTATAAALVGSVLADLALVAVATTVFSGLRGYEHFRFGDYAPLTSVGVLGAAVAWPVVNRISSAARWLYLRLAVAVTVVLLVPDVAIAAQGQPFRAVGVLVLMHLVIAAVTYLSMTRLAEVGPPVASRIQSRS